MKNRLYLSVLLLLTAATIFAQDLSSKGIEQLHISSDLTDYSIGAGGDTLYARYLNIVYTIDPAASKFTVLLQNISDTAAVTTLTNAQYTVPGSNATNSGLYSLGRNGQSVKVYMGNLSLFSRFRISVWIEDEEQPSYTADF